MSDKFLVIGGTRGTGLEIIKRIVKSGSDATVLVRDPDKATGISAVNTRIVKGDVTDPRSLNTAFDEDYSAIFYAADATGGVGGRSFFGSAEKIRAVTYQGLVNTVEAAKAHSFMGRMVLLSGMGCDKPSLAGFFLNAVKGNLQKNMVDREAYLKKSGLDFVVCRAGVLTDETSQKTVFIRPPVHSLSPQRKLSRMNFAQVLVIASQLPAASSRTYDVFEATGFNQQKSLETQLTESGR